MPSMIAVVVVLFGVFNYCYYGLHLTIIVSFIFFIVKIFVWYIVFIRYILI